MVTISASLLSPLLAFAGSGTEAVPLAEYDALRATIEAETGQLDAIVLRETVTRRVKELPGWTEEFRQRNADAMGANRDEVLVQLGDDPAPTALAKAEAELARKMAIVEDLVVTVRLNRTLSKDRKRTIDFHGQRARLDDIDLRDIDALLAAEGLDESMRGSVWRSQTLLVETQRTIRMPAFVPDLAVIMPVPRLNLNAEWLSLGILPESVFDGRFEFEIKRRDAIVELAAIDKDTGVSVLECTLMPERAYRLAAWQTYTSDGDLSMQMTLNDYRNIDGFWVPFATQKVTSRSGVRDYSVENTTLHQVEINPALDDDMFSIPEGMRIQDMTAAPHR
jgi:hypothetical protein